MAWHRLENKSESLLIIEEKQYGKPDEMDIERRADDYGRDFTSLSCQPSPK